MAPACNVAPATLYTDQGTPPAHMSSGTMQALATFGDEIAIAFSGAEDVAVIEYAHLTGRPFRVFRYA